MRRSRGFSSGRCPPSYSRGIAWACPKESGDCAKWDGRISACAGSPENPHRAKADAASDLKTAEARRSSSAATQCIVAGALQEPPINADRRGSASIGGPVWPGNKTVSSLDKVFDDAAIYLGYESEGSV